MADANPPVHRCSLEVSMEYFVIIANKKESQQNSLFTRYQ